MPERKGIQRLHAPDSFHGTAVIGAGVVGLAAAELLSRSGPVAVFEAEPQAGLHTSSRSSEVIHSGIYYPPGSLKAQLCVAGREQLYRYTESRGVPHRRAGKIVVATSTAEIEKLAQIQERGLANGVEDLRWLTGEQVHEMEPAVSAVAGLFSPSTGIIDSEELMRSLRRDAERNGADIVLSTAVRQGEVQDDGIVLQVGEDLVKFDSVVNSAGLHAQAVASRIEGVPTESIPDTAYAKGYYYGLEGSTPFSHLVYPVPVPGGLGTHATLDLAGRVRFGPNVEWLDTPPGDIVPDYSAPEDPERRAAFAEAIQRYWPALDPEMLHVDYAGIRPKTGRGAEQDFTIQGPQDHGVRGYVGLYGIESPGLTSSLAIAGKVEGLLRE